MEFPEEILTERLHTFVDDSWAINTATGWCRCLDVFGQIVMGNPINWQDNSARYVRSIVKRLVSDKHLSSSGVELSMTGSSSFFTFV